MGWLSSNDKPSDGTPGFASQFEPYEGGFVYRKGCKGAPIPISAAEKEAFIKSFERAQKITVYACVALSIFGVLVLTMIYPNDRLSPEWASTLLVGIVMLVILAETIWSWRAPDRALRARAAIGPARTAAEARRIALAQISYAQLFIAAGVGVLLLLKVDRKNDVLWGWNSFWVIVSALLIIGAAVGAYRKWRFDRPNDEG